MKMDKNTMFMIGAGVLGFIAVKFFLNKKEEKSSACGCGN